MADKKAQDVAQAPPAIHPEMGYFNVHEVVVTPKFKKKDGANVCIGYDFKIRSEVTRTAFIEKRRIFNQRSGLNRTVQTTKIIHWLQSEPLPKNIERRYVTDQNEDENIGVEFLDKLIF